MFRSSLGLSHGHLPEREVMTSIGLLRCASRARDRGAGAKDAGRIRFTPAILPPYAPLPASKC
jgi:hypothetical protein